MVKETCDIGILHPACFPPFKHDIELTQCGMAVLPRPTLPVGAISLYNIADLRPRGAFDTLTLSNCLRIAFRQFESVATASPRLLLTRTHQISHKTK